MYDIIIASDDKTLEDPTNGKPQPTQGKSQKGVSRQIITTDRMVNEILQIP